MEVSAAHKLAISIAAQADELLAEEVKAFNKMADDICINVASTDGKSALGDYAAEALKSRESKFPPDSYTGQTPAVKITFKPDQNEQGQLEVLRTIDTLTNDLFESKSGELRGIFGDSLGAHLEAVIKNLCRRAVADKVEEILGKDKDFTDLSEQDIQGVRGLNAGAIAEGMSVLNLGDEEKERERDDFQRDAREFIQGLETLPISLNEKTTLVAIEILSKIGQLNEG